MRILVAAGGTGGHIFPGVFIVDALQEQAECHVLFVGAGRPVEQKIISESGYTLRTIKTVGIKQRGIKGFLEFLFGFPRAFLQTWRLFSEFSPEVVLATGGYVGFFPFLVAVLRGTPRWLHEAERAPGLANSILSIFANRVSLAFADAKMPWYARTIFTGHPVRKSLLTVRKNAIEDKVIQNVLILGGSQGARSLDEFAAPLASWLSERGMAVWHQCREENRPAIEAAYDTCRIEARVQAFISDLAPAYEWADLVIARAGAGTVSEIAVVNVPTIFVPFPFAQGNHQEANANTLVEIGKALLVKEGEAFSERLLASLESLCQQNVYLEMQRREIPDRPLVAATVIAEGLRGLSGAA